MTNIINYTIEQAKNIPIVVGQQRIFAVITDKKGRILSEGTNSYTKTHTFQFRCATKTGLKEKCFLHAEISAICKLSYQHKKRAYKLYIARVGNNDKVLLAAPCIICQEAISQTSIQVIEYTTSATSNGNTAEPSSKVVYRDNIEIEAKNDSNVNKASSSYIS